MIPARYFLTQIDRSIRYIYIYPKKIPLNDSVMSRADSVTTHELVEFVDEKIDPHEMIRKQEF